MTTYRTIAFKLLLCALLLVSMLTMGTAAAQDTGTSIRIFANDRPETRYIAHGSITGTGTAMFSAMHCRLLTLDADYNLLPDLAERWEVADDDVTYTFYLDPDARWQDGTPVTAADVEFSWVAFATTEAQTGSRIRPPVITSVLGGEAVRESAAEADGYADTLKYEGIEIIDDHTIRFTLTGPNPLWIITSNQSPNGWLLPKHILGDVPYLEWAEQPIFFEEPIGCGAYRLVQHVEGQFVELEAFEDYHKGKPNIDRVFFMNWLTEAVGIAQIESGELDLMLNVSPLDADRLTRTANVELLTRPAGAAYQLSINTLRVTDPRVRLAMAYALDREAMLESVFLGQGKVQECCFLNDWAIPEGQTPYPYDPDRARELLAEAGWDSSRELSIIFPMGYRQSDTLVPIIQQQLAEVGIRTVIDAQESAAFRQKLIEEKDWDIFFNQGANMLPDPGSFTVWECPTGGFAQSGWIYCEDEMADLYKAGRTTVDPEARREIYQKIQTIFYEQMPTVNLFVPFTIAVAQAGLLEGIDPTPFYSEITWNIHEWSVKR